MNATARVAVAAYRWPDVARMVALAVAYAILVRGVLGIFPNNGTGSIVWPASGLAIAALLMGGKKYWPGIFIGGVAGNLLAGTPIGVTLGISLGNTLEALLGVWMLLRDGGFDPSFTRPKDYVRLGFVAFIIAFVSTAIGGMTTGLAGLVTRVDVLPNLLHSWQGNMLGIIVVTPLLMVWRRAPRDWFIRARAMETVALFGLTYLFGGVVFLNWYVEYFGIGPSYWMFPFITWGAVRFGRHGALLIVAMITVQSLQGAIQNVGIFAAQNMEHQLTNLWLYMLVLGIVGVPLALAIHERKQVDESIRVSETRFRSLSESSPIGIFQTDHVGRCVYTNRRWQDIHGFTAEPGSNEWWSRLLHKEDRAAVLAEWSKTAAIGADFVRDYRVVRPDGDVRFVHTRSRPIFSAEDRLTGFVGTVVDITETKRAEHELKRTTQLLLGVESMTRVGGWELDLVRGTLFWSDETYRIHDTNPVDFSPTLENAIGFYAPESVPAISAAVRAAAEHGTPFDLELQLITAKGRRIWVHANSTVTIEHGKPVKIAGAFQDITERKSNEVRQHVLMRELDHRVKNTLASVLSLAKVSVTRTDSPGKFLADFTGRVQSLSFVHAALAKNRWDGVDLSELARLTLGPYLHGEVGRVQIEGPGLNLPASVASPLCMTFHELTTNATKYGALSNPEGRVAIQWNTEGDQVWLTWSESGGPAVSTPTKTSIGTNLIRGFIEYELRGSVDSDYAPTGLICKIGFRLA